MGCFLPSSFHCRSMAPTAYPDVSTSNLNWSSSLVCASTGSVVMRLFSASKASCSSAPHRHSSLRVSLCSG